ncbi:ankyrin repeat-containing domain protein, partial [Baffinella frigidus]
LHRAVVEGDNAAVGSLLAAGSALMLDAKDKIGATPLHWACSEGYHEIVDALLEAGAAKDARDNQGRTPLHYAVRQSNPEVVVLLLAAGVDKDAHDKNGLSALLASALAGQHENMQTLRQAGA